MTRYLVVVQPPSTTDLECTTLDVEAAGEDQAALAAADDYPTGTVLFVCRREDVTSYWLQPVRADPGIQATREVTAP